MQISKSPQQKDFLSVHSKPFFDLERKQEAFYTF